MTLYTYTVEIDNAERHLLSFDDPDNALKKGLIGKRIIGYLIQLDKGVKPDNVAYNPEFVELFRKAIKSAALASEDLMKAALQQKNGFVYIVDQRANDQEQTKSKDILGSLAVTEGQINADSFRFNPGYEIISAEGLFKLPDDFERALVNGMNE